MVVLFMFAPILLAQGNLSPQEAEAEFRRLFQDEGSKAATAFISEYLDETTDENGLFLMGWSFYVRGEYEKAELIGWQLRGSRDIKLEASSNLLLGHVYFLMPSDTYNPSDFFNEAIELAKKAGFPKIVYRAYIGLAEVAVRENKLKLAQLYLSDAIKMVAERNEINPAAYHRTASLLALRDGDYALAEFQAQKALRHYEKMGQSSEMVASFTLSVVQIYSRKYPQAIAGLESAIPFFEEKKDTLRLVTAKVALAVAKFCSGEKKSTVEIISAEIADAHSLLTDPFKRRSFDNTIKSLLLHCDLKEKEVDKHRE
jgi:tetratricopeptide (TPR) repeat protein